MARYDVSVNSGGPGYLLNVQSDLLDVLNTAVVVPLLPLEAAPKPAQRLNPIFQIGGNPYVMTTQFLAAVPVNILGAPVANFKSEADEITAALDMVFQGF